MSKPDEYSTNALECERMAENSLDLNDRAVWLQLARRWLRMIPNAGTSSERLESAQGQTKPGRRA
jgi:hypothetical protein